MEPLISAAVIAVVTGIITGALSSLGTVSSMRVHIEYIRSAIERHDARLLEVEKEQHKIAGAIGVNANGPAAP